MTARLGPFPDAAAAQLTLRAHRRQSLVEALDRHRARSAAASAWAYSRAIWADAPSRSARVLGSPTTTPTAATSAARAASSAMSESVDRSRAQGHQRAWPTRRRDRCARLRPAPCRRRRRARRRSRRERRPDRREWPRSGWVTSPPAPCARSGLPPPRAPRPGRTPPPTSPADSPGSARRRYGDHERGAPGVVRRGQQRRPPGRPPATGIGCPGPAPAGRYRRRPRAPGRRPAGWRRPVPRWRPSRRRGTAPRQLAAGRARARRS